MVIKRNQVNLMEEAELQLGYWLSAALDDKKVCYEMKLCIVNWMTAMGERDNCCLVNNIMRMLRGVDLSDLDDNIWMENVI